ncbi:MAG: ABC transporter ATP-binding protein [Verrucomicrobiota bacterium]|nr:ABC transporter ATP-binding protein [Verrucomicrobiota bacterium]
MSDYVELFNLTKTYPTPKGAAVIVQDFNLRIKKGEFVALIGHSGCGKSTVLSMLAGLNDISGGGIILAGKELSDAGPDRGVVFQSPCLLPWMTAFENVLLGVNQVFFTASKTERRQIAEYYLTVVGLGDAMHKRPPELSQGMKQRVGIARAFALSPKMLLLDEPFGMLDTLTRIELQQVLLDVWQRTKLTALMVTHDVDEAIFLADRVVMMTNGPAAGVGDTLPISFPRPRNRAALLENTEYYRCREYLITFLEERAHRKTSLAKAA